MASNGELGKRVASGVAWSISEKIGSALLQIVVSIVVANRVMPIDMGIIAVLAVFTALAQVVVDSGFSQTLIRKSNPDQSDFNAVFRFNIISSLALYIILTAIAPFVADFYGWPMLAKVAPVLFLLLPLNVPFKIYNNLNLKKIKFLYPYAFLLITFILLFNPSVYALLYLLSMNELTIYGNQFSIVLLASINSGILLSLHKSIHINKSCSAVS